MRRRLFSERMHRDLQGYHAAEVLEAIMGDAPVEHHLDRVEYADLKTYLPGDILTKVDRASMATSLEVRVPMLDHKLIEWSSGLSPELKRHGTEGKYLLKKAMVAVDAHLRGEHPGASLLLTVHDELVVEVPADDISAVTELVTAEMEGVEALDVPLVVEAGSGPTWFEAKA